MGLLHVWFIFGSCLAHTNKPLEIVPDLEIKFVFSPSLVYQRFFAK